ncbi:MAG: site-2 protease family protein [Burkholderiales bacterium]
MLSGIRVGSVSGIEVFVDWSLMIIFFLVTFSLGAGLFPAWHPEWSAALIWSTALAAAVLFFVSVFIHELSHALVGRAMGIEIRRITLFIFGGMAHLEREPHTWRAELWMAIVGPVVSLLLGGLFLLVGGLALGESRFDPESPEATLARMGPLTTLFLWLGPINIVLGLFNLVPGFPLDGGRVLRAITWGITGNLKLATQWASRLGQFFAWVLIGIGIAMMLGVRVPIFGTGLLSGIWLAFIGWFLNQAALMSYRQLLVRESLDDVPVSRVMQSQFTTVESTMTLSRLVDEHLLHSDQRAYPVVDGFDLVGLVCLEDLRKVPREAWERTRVSDIMTPASKLAQVAPTEDTSDALTTLTNRGVNQLPVVENGRVRGLVRREDILRWLALRGDRALVP